MDPKIRKLDRSPLLTGLASLCGFLAAMSAAPMARGQCLSQQLAKLTASDAAPADIFGSSVAVSGDTAVVGAYQDDDGGSNAGAAYVFVLSGGVWTQQAKLTAADAAADDFFGWSVAVSGDTAVVGARFDDHAGGADAGSAYVFVRSGGVWTQQAKLIDPTGASGDFLGFSIALDGDTAVVGAFGDDGGTFSNVGSASVFVRTGTVWSLQSKLGIFDAAAGDQFGWSVAVSGDRIVVGAILEEFAAADTGAAHVFYRSGSNWILESNIYPTDLATNDRFGFSVALSGFTAVIGARMDDGGWIDAGSAYIFINPIQSPGAVWTQQAKLSAAEGGMGDFFGTSVAISGDLALIGALNDTHAAGNMAGSACVFARSGTTWTQQTNLLASDGAANDLFGCGVSLAGDTALVGANSDDHAGGTDAGSAYVFFVSPNTDCDGDGVTNLNDICPTNTPGLPTAPNGRPLRDCNNDCNVDGQDVPCIVAELLG